MKPHSDIKKRISESIQVKQALLADDALLARIQTATDWCIEAFRNKNKVLLCGNGGSASDAQHIAAELSGRFYKDRPPLFAEALNINTAYLTAVANDYSFDYIFQRSIEAKGREGDILIGISTSGNSPNVVKAMRQAQQQCMKIIGLTGETGGKLAELNPLLLNVPSKDTPRIQEAHILIGHIICELVENELF